MAGNKVERSRRDRHELLERQAWFGIPNFKIDKAVVRLFGGLVMKMASVFDYFSSLSSGCERLCRFDYSVKVIPRIFSACLVSDMC